MLRNYFLLITITLSSFSLHAQFDTQAEQLRMHVHVLASDSLLGRGFGTEQGSKAARYIAEQYRTAGIEPLNGSYLYPFYHRTGILNISGINVVGIIPGNDPDLKDEYILLGAHFDHLGWDISSGDTIVYHGADDNASGTASIIEIGRSLVTERESLDRSIVIVAFDGEESGLVGSNHFLKDLLVPPDKIRLMFSLDMVGMYKAHRGLDMLGVKRLIDHEQVIGDLAEKYHISIRKANRSIASGTDTAPFGNVGIPAIHATTGHESPYHKPTDVAGKLDFEGMAQVTNYISAVAHQLSSVENLSKMQGPRTGQTDLSGTKIFRPGVRVGLGSSYHNYRVEFYDGKSILSTEGGLFAQIRAASFLAIQPEVLYEMKGSHHTDGIIRIHSITTPLSLLITTPEIDMVRSYFLAGGYYSYHFGGKVNDTTLDFRNDYNKQEFGVSFGFGFQVMNVQMGLCFRRGLSNLLRDPDAGSVTHQGISFSLGYFF